MTAVTEPDVRPGPIRRVVRGIVNGLSVLPGVGPAIYAIKDSLSEKQSGTYFVCNVAAWKQPLLEAFLRNMGAPDVKFVSRKADRAVIRNQFCGHRDSVIVIWGASEPVALMSYVRRRGFRLWRMEDGFLRSRGLGAHHIPPASLILDKSGGIYFRADKPSDLEHFLSEHEFTEAELTLASRFLQQIVSANLTKYNLVEEATDFHIDPSARNILIFGQCEDDQSIMHGSPEIKLNSHLIEKVIEEFPGASFYFRPHPDVTAGLRPELSDISIYADRITIMEGPYPVWENIDLFDTVCVMTSLAGFEAIMRGKPVRTYGMPFYAGWGLTKDHISCPRRSRKLSLEAVFYGAYIEAPTYISPETGSPATLEATLDSLGRIPRFEPSASLELDFDDNAGPADPRASSS